jgi:hypothetical protein
LVFAQEGKLSWLQRFPKAGKQQLHFEHIGMRRIASAASDSGKTKFFYNCFDRWTDGRKYFLKRRLRGDQAGLEWLWARGLAALAPPDKG